MPSRKKGLESFAPKRLSGVLDVHVKTAVVSREHAANIFPCTVQAVRIDPEIYYMASFSVPRKYAAENGTLTLRGRLVRSDCEEDSSETFGMPNIHATIHQISPLRA